LWRPQWDWGVFGPYVSKNHFAGYMAMAIPLAFALAGESLQRLRHEWGHRRVGWLALGGSAGNAVIRWTALAMLLVVGLLASQSRGGLLAFAVSSVALPFAFQRRRSVAAMVVAVSLLAVAWVDLSGTWKAFQGRGVRSSRLDLWTDALPMVRSFPVFGSGLDTFGTAYTSFQTIAKYEWYGEVHNEYLQVLLDTGVIGAGIVAGLLGILLDRSARAARLTPLDAGRLASVLALCAHNLVDFNWQIPANAATFAALAAVAVRRGARGPKGWKDIALTPRGRTPRIAEPRGAPRRGSGGGEVRRAGTK
jgi:O-antigen ligase